MSLVHVFFGFYFTGGFKRSYNVFRQLSLTGCFNLYYTVVSTSHTLSLIRNTETTYAQRDRMSGENQSIHCHQQAEYPKWITPELIAEAKSVLFTSNRPDAGAVELIIAFGRLLDAAGVLKGKNPL